MAMNLKRLDLPLSASSPERPSQSGFRKNETLIRTMRYFFRLFFMTLLLPPTGHAFQETPVLPAAVAAFERLKSQDAGLLSPKSYAQAQKAHEQYTRTKQQNRPETEIRNAYAQLEAAVSQVNDRIGKAAAILADPLEARAAARIAEAPVLAAKEYAEAESRIREALVRLEDGKAVDADRIGREAIPLFQTARIAAHKIQLLGTTQTLLGAIKERKGDQFAPVSYQQALAVVAEVAGRLDRGELPSPELSAHALQAQYEARHAQVISGKVDTLQRDQRSHEKLLLEQETLARLVAQFSGIGTDFLSGPQPVVEQAIETLRGRQDSTQVVIASYGTRTGQMQTTIDSLKSALAQQQIRVAAMIDEYQQNLQTRKEELEQRRREIDQDLKKRMLLDLASQAQTRFTPREMTVLRDQKSVTLRLLGLEFLPSNPGLTEKHAVYMDRLVDLLLLYPKGNILVENHTDASGTETKNMEVSELRAASVREYISGKTSFPPEQLTAKGRGASVPIADNATSKGREQNRRTEIVVSF